MFVSPLTIGNMTQWGEVCAVGMRDGERYYMMAQDGGVALMPGPVVESSIEADKVESHLRATMWDQEKRASAEETDPKRGA